MNQVTRIFAASRKLEYMDFPAHGLCRSYKRLTKEDKIAALLDDATCWKNNLSKIAADLPGFKKKYAFCRFAPAPVYAA
jgi:hypothetical protein